MKGNKTMIAETKARELLENATTNELLIQWELTSQIDNENIPTVRGWLMDELEKRNPKGFNKWLDESAEDDELKNYFK